VIETTKASLKPTFDVNSTLACWATGYAGTMSSKRYNFAQKQTCSKLQRTEADHCLKLRMAATADAFGRDTLFTAESYFQQHLQVPTSPSCAGSTTTGRAQFAMLNSDMHRWRAGRLHNCHGASAPHLSTL
jgi:hypothetical protein